jgi:hypothetical protein
MSLVSRHKSTTIKPANVAVRLSDLYSRGEKFGSRPRHIYIRVYTYTMKIVAVCLKPNVTIAFVIGHTFLRNISKLIILYQSMLHGVDTDHSAVR